ncbi:unnamed protein product [Cylindrotheca closterium]|uniref:Helicase-associated domain-containing protein n=1 Tax=Cylindrotheca closterium TaxID=2856 RepID=A0AAD2JI54_9STRA|nr:unnamed protein product [Cylindrotheca closterium]
MPIKTPDFLSPSFSNGEQQAEDAKPGYSESNILESSSASSEDDESSKNRKRSASVETWSPNIRFRPYQSQGWRDDRFEDLLAFRKANGHCFVPYDYPTNPSLARWVKRQRYQYKIYPESERSTMTPQRIRALESIGFIWDAQTAAWEVRLSELRAYRAEHGDCNVFRAKRWRD